MAGLNDALTRVQPKAIQAPDSSNLQAIEAALKVMDKMDRLARFKQVSLERNPAEIDNPTRGPQDHTHHGSPNAHGQAGVIDFDGAVFGSLWRERSRQQFLAYLRYYISDHRPLWADFGR